MENIKIVERETLAGTETHVIIEVAENSFISMLKSTYDEQQKAAELSKTL